MNATYIEYFNYLNELRDSGETNMFLASPYLEYEFGLNKEDAKRVLLDWIGYKEDREIARREVESEAYYNR